MTSRSKDTAFATAALGLAVAAVAAWSLRPLAEEEWRIWKLRSTDPGVRMGAAHWLGEKGSVRAIGPLLEASRTGLRPVFDESLSAELYKFVEVQALHEIAAASGAGCVPPLRQALGHEDWYVRYLASRLLGEIGAAARPALVDLTELAGDPETRVRDMALAARTRIGGEGR